VKQAARLAVVGGGIAGMAAAWRLQQSGAEVHLYEREARLGGHTHTHSLTVADGQVNVDTGFIVFNDQNYPAFSQWLQTLGVAAQPSNMSFAVRDELAQLEYGTTNLAAILGNTGQLKRSDFWRMWWDLLRFYRSLDAGAVADISLGEYLHKQGYGAAFIDSHILPMCAALWSQPAEQSSQLSLRHVVDFMRIHRMLRVTGRPAWRVVQGGSATYVRAFRQQFVGQVHTQCPVEAIRRTPYGVNLRGVDAGDFDAVVVACHSDQALALLENPSATERAVLGAIPYQQNRVCLHSDTSFMPRNTKCWLSWNVTRETTGSHTITYWMNKLQNLSCAEQFFVTLNPPREPQALVWEGQYAHPHFTQASAAAQRRWAGVGSARVRFAGAYWAKGFHEDGFISGIEAAESVLREGQLRAA